MVYQYQKIYVSDGMRRCCKKSFQIRGVAPPAFMMLPLRVHIDLRRKILFVHDAGIHEFWFSI